MRERTNEQWLAELRGPNPGKALADLYVTIPVTDQDQLDMNLSWGVGFMSGDVAEVD